MNYLGSGNDVSGTPASLSIIALSQRSRIGTQSMQVYVLRQQAWDSGQSEAPALGAVIRECEKNWFASWARQWKEDTAGSSSIHRKVAHPAFQAILGMSPEAAIPLILNDLKKETAHWFPALKKLSRGQDPVPIQSRGNVEEMRRAWLQWGREQNLIG